MTVELFQLVARLKYFPGEILQMYDSSFRYTRYERWQAKSRCICRSLGEVLLKPLSRVSPLSLRTLRPLVNAYLLYRICHQPPWLHSNSYMAPVRSESPCSKSHTDCVRFDICEITPP